MSGFRTRTPDLGAWLFFPREAPLLSRNSLVYRDSARLTEGEDLILFRTGRGCGQTPAPIYCIENTMLFWRGITEVMIGNKFIGAFPVPVRNRFHVEPHEQMR